MSLRTQLKSLKRSVNGRRWTIRRDKNAALTEVKMIFKPEEYVKFKSARVMYGDKALLKILEDENKKNNS
jgi:hypothetical protein